MAFSSPFGSELFHTGKSDRPPGRGADLRVHKRISSRTPPSSFALFAKHLWFAIPPLSPPASRGEACPPSVPRGELEGAAICKSAIRFSQRNPP